MTVKIKVTYNPNFQKHPQDFKTSIELGRGNIFHYSTAFIPQFPKIPFSFFHKRRIPFPKKRKSLDV